MDRTTTGALCLLALGLAAAGTCPGQELIPAPTPLPLPRDLPAQHLAAEPSPANLQTLRRELAELQAALGALRAEREAVAADLPDLPRGPSPEAARLRERIHRLVAELNAATKPAPARPPEHPGHPGEPGQPGHAEPPAGANPPPAAPAGAGKPAEPPPREPIDPDVIDPVHFARTLLRLEKYRESLEVYRQIRLENLPPHEQVAVQYWTATCYRKLGEADKARQLYRLVANSRDDEILAKCAQWHLQALGWRDDLNARLQSLRERNQRLGGRP